MRNGLRWCRWVVPVALLSVGCFKSPGSGGSSGHGSSSGGSTTGSHMMGCSSTTDCANGSVCSNGACVPGCQNDSDCADGGICGSNGTCAPPQQCTLDTDCSAGFICQQGVCNCTTDYSCWVTSGTMVDTSQICVGGKCQESMSCTADSDCTDGRYCGPAQVCTAPCMTNADCGGNSQLGALTCANGRCSAPCVQDTDINGIGGCPDGQICVSNVCSPAECMTFTDCGDPTLLCTSANHGHCVTFTLCNPSQPEVCGPESDCTTYADGGCPPGFDCSQDVCISLPTCFVNNQCPSGDTCDLGVCRYEPSCMTDTDCPANDDCIGGVCLPHVCRGATDCADGGICTAGECQAPSTGSNVYQVRLLTPPGVLEVGQTMQLLAVALDAAGNAITVAGFTWSTTPGSVASVSSTGLLTALAAGSGTVTVGFTPPGGTAALPDSATFEVVAALDAGAGRVVVVDATTGAPISGALVTVCGGRDALGNCTAAQNLTTNASGAASFATRDGGLDIAAADPALGDAGAPVHDIVHVVQTRATDVLISLPGNEADGASGFTGSVNFSQVQTTGNTNIALAGTSIVDLASLQLDDILGQQPWTVNFNPDSISIGIPGLPMGLGPMLGLGNLLPGDGGNIPIPLTGATQLDLTSIAGVAVPIHIKDEIYALGSPGTRCLWTFAGIVDAQTVLGSLTSSTQNGAIGVVLPILGDFYHGLRVAIDEPLLPLVQDTSDLDGNDPNDTEILPDYAGFPSVGFRPAQPQSLEVDVAAPSAPSGAGQTLLLLGAQVPGAGLLPLGLSSIPAQSGDIIAHMAPLYGGLEASEYTVIAVATGGGGGGGRGTTALPDGGSIASGVTGGGNALSALVARSQDLPENVTLPSSFAPLIAGASYSQATRTLNPGTNWATVAAASQVVRIALVGSSQRVFIYASPSAIVNGLVIPAPPSGISSDPSADPNVTGSLVAAALPSGASLDSMAALNGPTLLNLSSTLVGFTRTPLQ